jgi:predicted Zn-dependent protease
MLWHEFAHVLTLHLTRNRMPRWLSEGISVYEELQASPAWGERLTPKYRELILEGELTPVASLSAAFLAPPSAERLQFAYYQSSLVVEFLVERFGADRLGAILRNLADGLGVNEAIEQHTVPMATFEQEFRTYARRHAEGLGPTLDWEKPALEALLAGGSDAVWETWGKSHPTNFYVLTRQAREEVEAGRWAEARAILDRLAEACPEFTGPESPWRQLAQVHRALGDPEAERAALARLAERDDEATDVYQRLCELAATAGDWPAVVLNAERFLAVDPLVPVPYRFLAQAAEATGSPSEAAVALRALLQLDPPNPAEIHFRLARQLHRLEDPDARRQVLLALEEAPRYREALRLLLELGPAPVADPPPAGAPPQP